MVIRQTCCVGNNAGGLQKNRRRDYPIAPYIAIASVISVLFCEAALEREALSACRTVSMALSPSPTSPLGVPDSGIYQSRRSATPPALPMSKRDKRRNQHLAHQQELLNEFASNHDQHYREQLIALQTDMSLISQADPYDPEPLEDSPEEVARIAELAASGTPYQSQMSSLAGKWYAEFVHEINDAKEAKELALIQLMVR